MSETVRTITITEDKFGAFIATSEDDPPLFCAATSLVGVAESVERTIKRSGTMRKLVNRYIRSVILWAQMVKRRAGGSW